ncbi:MAG TPA: hypothetical protein PK926_04650 [Spirochaetota bacterium]|nr:hypothetical protein [Spirochaetota bacterium]HPI88868.1 hypothetical protein [Spirochaetota bacterium]HPR47002.1 hypothetical protein [Spirochaetota bacterium]
MSITSDIEMMITEYTREGLRPKYIVIGYEQFKRWNEELRGSGVHAPQVDKTYLGCDVVICSSDIIEVVGEAADQFRYMSSGRFRR